MLTTNKLFLDVFDGADKIERSANNFSRRIKKFGKILAVTGGGGTVAKKAHQYKDEASDWISNAIGGVKKVVKTVSDVHGDVK